MKKLLAFLMFCLPAACFAGGLKVDTDGLGQANTWSAAQTFSTITVQNSAHLATLSGKVGVGIATPQNIFQVKQASDIDLMIAGGTAVTGAISLNAINDGNSANIALEIRSSLTDFSAGNVGVGDDSPDAQIDIKSAAAPTGYALSVSSQSDSVGGLLGVLGDGDVSIGGHMAGAVEGIDATVRTLIQFSSATVNGTLAVDFTDAGLKDYTATPYAIVDEVFDSTGDNLLKCYAHTVSTTAMTLECVISSGDGLGQTTAQDAMNRQVNYILMGTAP